MREIISLHAGQCGNQIGHRFWQLIAEEHKIDPQGHPLGSDEKFLTRLPVFFSESSTGRFVPRSILFDMEPGTLNFIRSSEWGSIYHPNSYIFGRTGAGNNWAKGHYGDGQQLVDAVADQMRKMAETCKALQGFELFHSTGGGTGSGASSRLLMKISDEYADRMSLTYSVFPSPKVSDVVVEPYNCVLTHTKLIENVHQVVCIDNEALYNVCNDTLEIAKPTYSDLNRLCCLIICGLTSSLRFPGRLNIDLRKNAVNLVPFPRLHFYCSAFAPLHTSKVDDYRCFSVADLTTQIFDANNLMAAVDPRSGLFLSASVIYRGDNPTQQVDEEILRIQTKYSSNFVHWIPHNIKTSVCDVPHTNFTSSVTMLCNTTSIADMFVRIDKNFDVMFRKNAFVHWYTGAGMEETEFTEAQANVKDLTEEYRNYGRREDEQT